MKLPPWSSLRRYTAPQTGLDAQTRLDAQAQARYTDQGGQAEQRAAAQGSEGRRPRAVVRFSAIPSQESRVRSRARGRRRALRHPQTSPRGGRAAAAAGSVWTKNRRLRSRPSLGAVGGRTAPVAREALVARAPRHRTRRPSVLPPRPSPSPPRTIDRPVAGMAPLPASPTRDAADPRARDGGAGLPSSSPCSVSPPARPSRCWTFERSCCSRASSPSSPSGPCS